jgi:hypothetical protein
LLRNVGNQYPSWSVYQARGPESPTLTLWELQFRILPVALKVENFCKRLATVAFSRVTVLHRVGVIHDTLNLNWWSVRVHHIYSVWFSGKNYIFEFKICFHDKPDKRSSGMPFDTSVSLAAVLAADHNCRLLFHFRERYVFFLYSSFDVMKYWPILEARWIWNCVAIERLIHDNGPRGTVSHVPAENFCRIKCASGKYKHGQYTRARRVFTPPLPGPRVGAADRAVHSCSETCCINTRSTSLYIIRHLITISSLFAVVACSVW